MRISNYKLHGIFEKYINSSKCLFYYFLKYLQMYNVCVRVCGCMCVCARMCVRALVCVRVQVYVCACVRVYVERFIVSTLFPIIS